MSLSFVSSAVLKSTDGVSHNEETPIESPEVLALQRKQQQARPLFEQLRSSQEEEEAARLEFQRSIMRGTRALDEEDVAHLDAVANQRMEREWKHQQEVQQEVAVFRAARAATSATAVVDDDDEDDAIVKSDKIQGDHDKEEFGNQPKPAPPIEKPSYIPKIVVKKRRRRVDEGVISQQVHVKRKLEQNDEVTNQPTELQVASGKTKVSQSAVSENNNLANLLGGYNSSESEDDGE
jgi:hypothetical protein